MSRGIVRKERAPPAVHEQADQEQAALVEIIQARGQLSAAVLATVERSAPESLKQTLIQRYGSKWATVLFHEFLFDASTAVMSLTGNEQLMDRMGASTVGDKLLVAVRRTELQSAIIDGLLYKIACLEARKQDVTFARKDDIQDKFDYEVGRIEDGKTIKALRKKVADLEARLQPKKKEDDDE